MFYGFSLELELNFLLYVQTFCWVIDYFNITDITEQCVPLDSAFPRPEYG